MVHTCKSADEFKAEIAKHKIVVVDFYATWCGPCRLIAPKLEAYENQYQGVRFLKVDVDELSDVAAESGIQAMPTFHFYKDGKKVKEVIGADANKVEATIKSLL